MRILSLFDGMACGMLAMMSAGVTVDRYVAYEIDKYAVKTASHNFPQIEQNGDVFDADFTQYEGFDFLIGGSPCTYWSIAQTNNRETTASGMGWELFSQYVRALHEAKPRFFIYENNKSMSKAIRDSIRETFGFEEVCINSALVSAQNRQRYYWVGIRNADGAYRKVDVKQPEDRGILLKDVLDGAVPYRQTTNNKAFCLDASYTKTPGSPESFLEGGHARCNRTMVSEPVSALPKSTCMNINPSGHGINGSVGRIDTKMRCLTTNKGEGPKIICPVGAVRVGTYPGSKCPECDSKQYRIYSTDGKAVTQCGQGGGLGAKTGLYAVPCRVGQIENGGQGYRIYSSDGKAVAQTAKSGGPGSNTGLYAIPMRIGDMPNRDGETSGGQAHRIYATDGKSVGLCARPNGGGFDGPLYAASIHQYAILCEWDENGIPTKAISGADGKTYTVYRVQDGQITIKGKTYPIKLVDGYWIIRKLTVTECMRLQTVPAWYDFSCVSNSAAYRMLGNGWTVEVIAHLIRSCLEGKIVEEKQMEFDC